MRGGLEIDFFSRRARQRRVPAQDLAAAVASETVREVILAMADPEMALFRLGSDLHSRDSFLESRLPDVALLVAIEHRDCEWCMSEVADGMELREWSISVIAEAIGARLDLFADFICVYLQTAQESLAAGADILAIHRQRLLNRLDTLLAPLGLAMVGDVPWFIREPTNPHDGADGGFAAAFRSVDEAYSEIEMSRPGDALTDLGTALQHALAAAGFSGGTLGEQVGAAKRTGYFTGVDTKLGSAVEMLSEWVAASRNNRSDAHAGDQATARQARLAANVVAGLVTYIATQRSGDG